MAAGGSRSRSTTTVGLLRRLEATLHEYTDASAATKRSLRRQRARRRFADAESLLR